MSDEQLRASEQVIGLCIPEESRKDEQGWSVTVPRRVAGNSCIRAIETEVVSGT